MGLPTYPDPTGRPPDPPGRPPDTARPSRRNSGPFPALWDDLQTPPGPIGGPPNPPSPPGGTLDLPGLPGGTPNPFQPSRMSLPTPPGPREGLPTSPSPLGETPDLSRPLRPFPAIQKRLLTPPNTTGGTRNPHPSPPLPLLRESLLTSHGPGWLPDPFRTSKRVSHLLPTHPTPPGSP